MKILWENDDTAFHFILWIQTRVPKFNVAMCQRCPLGYRCPPNLLFLLRSSFSDSNSSSPKHHDTINRCCPLGYRHRPNLLFFYAALRTSFTLYHSSSPHDSCTIFPIIQSHMMLYLSNTPKFKTLVYSSNKTSYGLRQLGI